MGISCFCKTFIDENNTESYTKKIPSVYSPIKLKPKDQNKQDYLHVGVFKQKI